MDSILIVSTSKKSIDFFTEILNQNGCKDIVTVENCGTAQRLLVERDFDLCIINAPLPDEFGANLARDIAYKTICQVVLLVKSELYYEVTDKVEDTGVITVSKPVNRNMFWSVLKVANSAFNKMSQLRNENSKLLQKIEDIRIIDRAKCILIEYLSMTEQQAHKYIEQQAMNMRVDRRTVAESILKTYES